MKIYYNCEYCGEAIDMIEMDQIDEVKLGFDCLTAEERQDIIPSLTLTSAKNAWNPLYIRARGVYFFLIF